MSSFQAQLVGSARGKFSAVRQKFSNRVQNIKWGCEQVRARTATIRLSLALGSGWLREPTVLFTGHTDYWWAHRHTVAKGS